MLEPEIKGWDCIEHDPIEDWIPEDKAAVDIWCNFAIGLRGSGGGDNFSVRVITEAEIRHVNDHRFLLIVPYYESWSQILMQVRREIADCKGLSWAQVSEQLARRFKWEYS